MITDHVPIQRQPRTLNSFRGLYDLKKTINTVNPDSNVLTLGLWLSTVLDGHYYTWNDVV